MHPLDSSSWHHLIMGGALILPLFLITGRRFRAICIIFALCAPVMIECIQFVIPSRTCDLTDILVSWAGSIFVLLLFTISSRKGKAS
jgi:glycopeptide antibiotics resistance protein